MLSSKSTNSSAQTELSTESTNSFSTAGDFRRCFHVKPESRDEQGGRQCLRYLLVMSLRHQLHALSGLFIMNNIASFAYKAR
ncbi:hypothetical protein PsAD14_00323 [Pseudovibrio sp. Ad14]|nr:hypothetical protein PsW74_05538 [Pseudovibrio sp. W74]KZL12156.1 hypothetical protein PsAD14_00323 [Pseudovibrio sp. Ad14]